MEDDDPTYHKFLSNLEARRRNPGDTTLASGAFGFGFDTSRDARPEARLDLVDIESGPVLRPEAAPASTLWTVLVALGVFAFLAVMAILLFPADEPAPRLPTQALHHVPTHISQVPDDELHEAFEPDVAEAELRLRRSRKEA